MTCRNAACRRYRRCEKYFLAGRDRRRPLWPWLRLALSPAPVLVVLASDRGEHVEHHALRAANIRAVNSSPGSSGPPPEDPLHHLPARAEAAICWRPRCQSRLDNRWPRTAPIRARQERQYGAVAKTAITMSHSTVPSFWSGSNPVSASIQSAQKMGCMNRLPSPSPERCIQANTTHRLYSLWLKNTPRS
jgi:hypothetical protein